MTLLSSEHPRSGWGLLSRHRVTSKPFRGPSPIRNGRFFRTPILGRRYPGNFGNFSFGCLAFHSLCDTVPSQAVNERGGRPRPDHVSPLWGNQYFGGSSALCAAVFLGGLAPEVTCAAICAFCALSKCWANRCSTLITCVNASAACSLRNVSSCCSSARISSASFALADAIESRVGFISLEPSSKLGNCGNVTGAFKDCRTREAQAMNRSAAIQMADIVGTRGVTGSSAPNLIREAGAESAG